MIIVGNNLKNLIEQHQISDKNDIFDDTCISLRLGGKIINFAPTDDVQTLIYGEKIPDECLVKEEIGMEGFILKPHSCILACSLENINIPIGYFGLLQTKGSLARLFISIHQSDGQIDPGFRGNITFEIYNSSPFNIKIFKGQRIGNLYLFKTSTKNHLGYNGKYQNSSGPTFQKED